MPILQGITGGRLIGSAPLRPQTGTASGLVASPASWLDGPGSSISGGWLAAAKYESIARHSVVKRCLLKHADAESAIRLHVHDRRTKERVDRAKGTNGAAMFAELLRDGMPAGRTRTRHWIGVTRRQYGSAYLVCERNDKGVIIKLWPVSPLVIHWDNGQWVVVGDTGTARFAESDVLVLPNTLGASGSIRSGVSSLDTLTKMVDADNAMSTALYGWWKQGARPAMVLRHPKTLSDPARRALSEDWREHHAGAENAGATVILEEAMEVVPLPFNAEAAQLTETRQQMWEEACVALDVPPAMIHLHQRSTFSNVTELHKAWYRDIKAPDLRQLEDDWRRLALVFGVAVEADVEYDIDAILWGSPLDRADVLAKTDHMTVAEKRRIDNLTEIDGTDRIMVNGAMVPLDAIDAWVSGRNRSSGTPETPPAKSASWSQSDVDQVLKTIRNARSLDDFDMEKATDGMANHCADALGVMVAIAPSMQWLRRSVKALTAGDTE